MYNAFNDDVLYSSVEIKDWFMDIHHLPEGSVAHPTETNIPAATRPSNPAVHENQQPAAQSECVKPKKSQRRRNSSRHSESDSSSFTVSTALILLIASCF